MASPPPRKESTIHWLKVPRRVFNRVRNAVSPNSRPHSPGTSTANINIPNDDLGVVRDRPHAIFSTPQSSSHRSSLLGVDSADRVAGVEGNRSQDTVFTTTTSGKTKKAWDVTRSGLLTALRILEKSADAFPPLKSAVGGLVACLDLAQVSHGCISNSLYV